MVYALIKRRLYEFAEKMENAEYTGEVSPRDPTFHLILQLVLWAVLFFGGSQAVQRFASGWLMLVVILPWLLISGILVRFGMGRFHGLSIPEYSDYLDKRMDRHQIEEERERAQRLEQQINQDIQKLKGMDVVDSVAVWGDGVDVELRQVSKDDDSSQDAR